MKKDKSAKLFSGYTLIEILIVIAIMGILFVAGYAGFRDFSRREQVNSALLALSGDIKAMQQMNLSGTKPFGCTGDLRGYNFEVINSTSYRTLAVCSNTNIQIKSVTLPSGLTIGTPTPNPIFFKSVGHGTNIPANTTATITLTQASTLNTRSIFITTSGEVREDSGLARVNLTLTPTTFYPTSTPAASPTATPNSNWQDIGTWTISCGSTFNFNVTANEFRARMLSGGGADGTMSYYCNGSSGIQILVNGTWRTMETLDCPISTNGLKTLSLSSHQVATSVRFLVGCGDGETASFRLARFGYNN